ncbi:penicillin-binding protein 2 [soil metagenome]
MSGDGSRHRLGLVAITALSLFAALFARLYFLQVVDGQTLAAQASSNTTKTVVIPAPRGRILDRNGTALVENRESITVAVDLQAYNALEQPEQVRLRERLATALNRSLPAGQTPHDTKSIDRRLGDTRFSRFRPIPIAEDISMDQEIYFSEQADRFPAVVVERQTVREYPYGSLAAHVLGYVGSLNEDEYAAAQKEGGSKPYEQSDEIGKTGVEAKYESNLRGTPGRRVYEVDRSNRAIREITSRYKAPKPGDDVYLSIDAKIQYKAEQALQGRLVAARGPKTPAPAGGVVVLDQSNGQVRAMASYPTYDPSTLVGGISCPVWRDLQGLAAEGSCKDVAKEISAMPFAERPASKLINRAMAGSYPPASTFKLASSYAALKLGIITPQDTISDPGYYRLCDGDGPGCLKKNAGSASHGSVDLQKALTVSSDVFFYRIGQISWQRGSNGSLAKTGMQDHIKELGYGNLTKIDLPGESPGNVPTPADEAAIATALFKEDPARYDNDPAKAKDAGRWRTGYSADLSIGQKVDATPLQTANAYAALANGGTLFQPQVLDRIQKASSPTVIKAFKPIEIRKIDWGTARDAYVQGFQGAVASGVGGNRGTAYSVFQGFPLDTWPVAGKTGTAQTGKDENGNQRPENSLFVGFSLAPGVNYTASAMLEGAGAGAVAAAPTVRLIFEPIATGEINTFVVPKGGEIDADAVAAQSAGIAAVGSD